MLPIQAQPRVLIQAVKRNRDRFPPDFMFQLTEQEFRHLKSQFVISSGGGSRRAYPYAFTEQGVAMLSSILRSKRAVQVNIGIMRVFVRLREMIGSKKFLLAASALRPKRFVIHATGVGSVAPAFARQQSLYFLPLPQGQGALRPIPWRRRGIMWSSDPVSW